MCCSRYQFDCNKWLSLDDGDNSLGYFLTPREVTEPKPEGLIGYLTHGFLEDHLWASVIFRVAPDYFTRVQRFSCCWALILLTMISNAMFFGKEKAYEPGWIIDLHFFQISYLMVYTSVVGVLVTLPVQQLTVQLFRWARPDLPFPQRTSCFVLKIGARLLVTLGLKRKPEPDNNDIEMGTLSATASISSYDDSNRKYFRSLLSKCSLALGWMLVFLSYVVPSFFLLLYSIEWGKEKSEDWLTTFFISFAGDLFVLDPFKVRI